MLNEMEQGVRSLLEFPEPRDSASSQTQEEPISADQLLKLWENRLQFTQVRHSYAKFKW